MLFNSFDFLLFFPIVVLVFFLIPQKIRYIWLLMSSYYFYMCWNPKYALLIFTSTAITYLTGLLIDKENQKLAVSSTEKTSAIVLRRKFFVGISFTSNLFILGFYKYFDFLIDNVNIVIGKFGFELLNPSFDILLPVGISFYTFQALSYTVDIYRKDVAVERNFLRYALFVSFFPQLVAGPIERSSNLLSQMRDKYYFDYDRMIIGLQLMLWGYFQKLVIADRVAIAVNTVYNNLSDYGGTEVAFATMLFAVQIYCDFSSYSIIALGAAKVLGFDLMENFNTPYFADSVGDFWRRWHISLSTWFRDYLYIPLGGSRKGRFRKNVHVMIVFMVSGLWHGANWTFVVWGFFNGFFQMVEDLTKNFRKRSLQTLGIDPTQIGYRILRVILTFILIDFTWIFFRANSLSDALLAVKIMITNQTPWVLFNGGLFQLGIDEANMILLGIALLVLFGVSLCKYNKIPLQNIVNQQILPIRWTIYLIGIFSILVFGIYGPNFDAASFIYFQF